jgi:hypothetical protein
VIRHTEPDRNGTYYDVVALSQQGEVMVSIEQEGMQRPSVSLALFMPPSQARELGALLVLAAQELSRDGKRA